jgi:hypothetical protein
MQSKQAVLLLAITFSMLQSVNCDYVGRYVDRQCADELAGQIAENSIVYEFVPIANSRRILSVDEKNVLFSKINLPACASGTNSPGEKYNVAVSRTEFGYRTDVWLTDENPKISD